MTLFQVYGRITNYVSVEVQADTYEEAEYLVKTAYVDCNLGDLEENETLEIHHEELKWEQVYSDDD